MESNNINITPDNIPDNILNENNTFPGGYPIDNISDNYGIISNPQWIHNVCPTMNIESLNIVYKHKFTEETKEIMNIHKDLFSINIHDKVEDLSQDKEVIKHQNRTKNFLKSFHYFLESFQEQKEKTLKAEKEYKMHFERTQDDIDKISDFKDFMVKIDTKYSDVVLSTINESIVEVAQKIKENNECEQKKKEYIRENDILQHYLKCVKNINSCNIGSTCSLCLQRQVDTFMEPCGHTGCSECIQMLQQRNFQVLI